MDGRGFWQQLHGIADTINRQGGPNDFLTRCIERDLRTLTPDAQCEAQQALETVATTIMIVRATLHVQAAVEHHGEDPPRTHERKAG